MRVKAVLIIMAIVFAVTAANFALSFFMTKHRVREAMEQDLFLALDIADGLVTTNIKLLESQTGIVAERLLQVDEHTDIQKILESQLIEFPGFSGLTVFDQHGIVAHSGVPIAPAAIRIEESRLQMAFNGVSVITSPYYEQAGGNFIMHVLAPLGQNRALSATMPGLFFSRLLAEYRLWKSGGILLVDAEGVIMASRRVDLVMERRNFITEAATATSPEVKKTGVFFQNMITSSRGVGTFSLEGETRLCAYRHISGSHEGWRIAVAVPLAESPQADVQWALLLSALLFLAAGSLAAIVVSKAVVQPFLQIEQQNRSLMDLNATVNSQMDAINEAHRRSQYLLDAMPITCQLWRRDHQVFDCNEEVLRLFNVHDKREYLDRFYDFCSEYQAGGMSSLEKGAMYLDKVFTEGRCVFEWMYQLPDGTPVPTEVTLVRINFGDEEVAVGYGRDLREHKQMMEHIREASIQLEAALEAARNASQAKTNFLAGMSHEMRTPLNAVIGLSALTLEGSDLYGESRLNIEKVYNAGVTLLHMVNDILDISKIEAGRFELVPVVYDLPSLINDTVTQSGTFLGGKPVSFTLDIKEDLPVRLYGDDLRIKQIINNLLSNAFKYTRQGTVVLRVRCAREDNDVWLTVQVQDTGIGIRPEDIPGLFADYHKLDLRANRNIEGTGLGLPIAKNMAEMMDGSIAVESEYGKGSTFTVKLRQGFVADDTIGVEMVKNLENFRYAYSKRDGNLQMRRARLSYARVLVVDDIVTNLDVAKGMLQLYGMQVDCVTGGQQAIDAVRAEKVRYNAIFMDQMMPGLDGIETTRIIREKIGTEYARTIPIIALTANAVVGNDQIFLRNGFQAFLSKPIETAALDAVIQEWVRDKKLEEELQDTAESAQEEGAVEIFPWHMDGVDLQKGFERFGKDEGSFLQVLRSYATNTRPLLEAIRRVDKDALPDYAIIVHGIKGSSGGIYADAVSAKAAALEEAAKAGDYSFVSANNPAFLESVAHLVADLECLLGKIAEKKHKPKKDKLDGEVLSRLLAACGNYDMDGVDAAMAEIESSEYISGGELVLWLRENVDRMNFKQITKKLEAIAGYN